jgi:predicted Fe-Mo cluster-binding NifX family protein
VRICIGCSDPGGPDAAIIDPLEMSDIVDYYELHENGKFEHTAQTRKCVGGCADLVESIIRRGVEKVVVLSLSPNSLLKLSNCGVLIYKTDDPRVRVSLDLLSRNDLKEIDIREFSRMAKM